MGVVLRPLWSLGARDLAAAYADGLTPAEVLAVTLTRIREVNGGVNAIVTLDEVGASRAAALSTQRWRHSRALGPLDGVPVTIKDNIFVEGLPAVWGSRLYRDHVAAHDETPVRKLRDAGAVILGKTNVPEFTVHGYTDNRVFGTTRNPWNRALTPGGSSGGAVAGVALGMGALALATDGGGSIRRPSAHTGLVGFKPSRGMVPRNEGFPAILHDFEVIGPIARCVDDVVLAMDVIAGPAWAQSKADASPMVTRIAFAPAFDDAPVDPLIRAAVGETIARLRALGVDIDDLSPFRLAEPLATIWPLVSQTGVAWLLARHPDGTAKVSPAIAEMARAGERHGARDYLDALDNITAMGRAFATLFARYDFLITPATAAMPWPATESHPAVIDGQPVGPRGHAVFTPLANALGLPAISLPCRVDAGALPVGLQVVAAHNRDAALLAFAGRFEAELFSHRWPPEAAAAEST